MRSRAGYGFALLCTFWIAALAALSGEARSQVPFTFTVPSSKVVVKISDPSLRPDAVAGAKPNYFKLSRREPVLIMSGWLEPARPGLLASTPLVATPRNISLFRTYSAWRQCG